MTDLEARAFRDAAPENLEHIRETLSNVGLPPWASWIDATLARTIRALRSQPPPVDAREAEVQRLREALEAVRNTDDHADPEVRAMVRAALSEPPPSGTEPTEEALTERERRVLQGYRKLVATGGAEEVRIISEADFQRMWSAPTEERRWTLAEIDKALELICSKYPGESWQLWLSMFRAALTGSADK